MDIGSKRPPMSEVWTRLEGQVVNGAFPLRRYLGSSDHSGVFLTEYAAQSFPCRTQAGSGHSDLGRIAARTGVPRPASPSAADHACSRPAAASWADCTST